ncbi:hypothetical protein GCM10029992_54870 [Glycomyces albus]
MDRRFDPAVLEGVEEVRSVRDDDREVTVTGTGDLLQAVSTALVKADVTAAGTRYQQATLEDAFLALTKDPIESEESA